MTRSAGTVAIALCLVAALAGRRAGDDAKGPTEKDPLQGAWDATAAEKHGTQAPPEVLKFVRFTFTGDKVLIRGSLQDDREAMCTFKADTTNTPCQIDIAVPSKKNPGQPKKVLGIYEIKGDDMQLCINGTDTGRPTEFASREDSDAILYQLKRISDSK